MNRNNKIDALIRFVKWQIGSRIVPGEVIYEWINGAKIVVRTGEYGLTGNIYAGLHDFYDMGYLLHVLCSDDLFVDVGANVGAYTILACASVQAKGFSFEPVFSTYQRLMTNIRINHLENKVRCFNSAVGAENRKIVFTSDRNAENRALSDNEYSDNAIVVNMTTLDIVLEKYYPNLIKIDVE